MAGRKGRKFRNDGHLYGHHSLNYKIIEYLKQLQIAVARGGIEPPTHGFSVRCSTNWAIWPLLVIPRVCGFANLGKTHLYAFSYAFKINLSIQLLGNWSPSLQSFFRAKVRISLCTDSFFVTVMATYNTKALPVCKLLLIFTFLSNEK